MSRNKLAVENAVFQSFLENFVVLLFGLVGFLNIVMLFLLLFYTVLIVHVCVTAYLVKVCNIMIALGTALKKPHIIFKPGAQFSDLPTSFI